jgi:hypothetical protein
MDSSEQLLRIIDDRVKKNMSPNIVYRTSVLVTSIIDNSKIKAIIPGFTTEYTFLNKTGETLVVGDSVIVESNGTNLNNGLVVHKFGASPVFEKGIESGTDYQKFADGTMICWKRITTALSIAVTVGSLFTNASTQTWTFPQEFIDTTNLVVSANAYGSGMSAGGVIIYGTSTANCTYRLYNSQSLATADDRIIMLQAIGKWK